MANQAADGVDIVSGKREASENTFHRISPPDSGAESNVWRMRMCQLSPTSWKKSVRARVCATERKDSLRAVDPFAKDELTFGWTKRDRRLKGGIANGRVPRLKFSDKVNK